MVQALAGKGSQLGLVMLPMWITVSAALQLRWSASMCHVSGVRFGSFAALQLVGQLRDVVVVNRVGFD